MKKRTICVISCLILVVSDDWQKQVFVHNPFDEKIPAGNDFRLLTKGDLKPEQHFMHLARNWNEAIESGYYESSTQIAQEVGMSSGRVRQIIRLNNLHPEIQYQLLSYSTRAQLSNYASKNLIKASSMSHNEQLQFLVHR